MQRAAPCQLRSQKVGSIDLIKKFSRCRAIAPFCVAATVGFMIEAPVLQKFGRRNWILLARAVSRATTTQLSASPSARWSRTWLLGSVHSIPMGDKDWGNQDARIPSQAFPSFLPTAVQAASSQSVWIKPM